MRQVVLLDELVNAREVRKGLLAHLELVVQAAELSVVGSTHHFSVHVLVLLYRPVKVVLTYEELDGFDEGVEVLVFVEIVLLLVVQARDAVNV